MHIYIYREREQFQKNQFHLGRKPDRSQKPYNNKVQIVKNNYSYIEIPVKYRNRIGVSKVSGTIKGAIFAGVKILYWIFKYSFKK